MGGGGLGRRGEKERSTVEKNGTCKTETNRGVSITVNLLYMSRVLRWQGRGGHNALGKGM